MCSNVGNKCYFTVAFRIVGATIKLTEWPFSFNHKTFVFRAADGSCRIVTHVFVELNNEFTRINCIV